METKSNLHSLILEPAQGGIIVHKKYDLPADEGRLMDPPHVFTNHEELCSFLFSYFVDTEAELKKRASK